LKTDLGKYLVQLSALAERNDPQFFTSYLHLCHALKISQTKPKSLWEPLKRRAVIQGLLETETVPGDVAELGVFMGGGTFLLAETLINMHSDRVVFAVDSFKGLPAPQEQDCIPSRNNQTHYVEGMFKEASYEYLSLVLKIWGLDNRVKVFKGFFEEVLPKVIASDHQFSLVIIDADQYQGTKFCLNFFYDMVSSGGRIYVDDYKGSFAEGVNRAVDEFLAEKNQDIEQGGGTMWFLRKS